MHSRISRMLLTPRLSNRTAPLMDYEMRWEQASTHKPNQFQTSRRWWDNLLLQFKLLRKASFQFNQCLILKEYMKQVPVHHSSMERSKQSWPYEKEKKSTTKWRCQWQKKIKLFLPVNVDNLPSEEKEETNPREYVPKAPFPQRLAKGKKGKSTCEILKIFK